MWLRISCFTTNKSPCPSVADMHTLRPHFDPGSGTTSTTHYVLRPTFTGRGRLEAAKLPFSCGLGARPGRQSCVAGHSHWTWNFWLTLGSSPKNFWQRCTSPLSVRLFETHHGHLEVDEMEGLIEYTGYLHAYWVLQITTHFDSPMPAGRSRWWSPTPTRSEESSRQTLATLVDGARPSFPGIVCLRTLCVVSKK